MTRRSDQIRQISILLPSDQKHLVEQAAAVAGQRLNDFVRTALDRKAQRVLAESRTTHVSDRDRDAFLAAVRDEALEPSASLTDAARRYKTRVGSD